MTTTADVDVFKISLVAGQQEKATPSHPRNIPAEAAMVISALEAGGVSPEIKERRAMRRRSYRVVASIWMFSDPPPTPPTVVYTRDVSRRGLGFVTTTPLPLSHGGIVELQGPDGEMLNLHCTLLRCRLAAPGWYEGTVYFNRDQPQFDVD